MSLKAIIRSALPNDAGEINSITESSWISTYVPLGVPSDVVQDTFAYSEEKQTSFEKIFTKN